MKIRVREMEAEAAKLREMQERAEKEMNAGGDAMDEGAEGDKEQDEADARSIYVGNVSLTGKPLILWDIIWADVFLCFAHRSITERHRKRYRPISRAAVR
jgi:hypothetical protein